ncbi:PP2C family protein-serine/threonine phosphatase [Acidobacteriota bacterium]
MSLFSTVLDFFGNIGRDPSDSEQTRVHKRIWTITLALVVPITAGMALTYLFKAKWQFAVVWAVQFVFWSGSLFLFAVLRNHIENFAFSSQTFLVLSSVLVTCLFGGFFRSDGIIFMGLIGVLYAMIFPSRKRAFFLFLLYLALFSIALVLELTIFRADAIQSSFSTLFFWNSFLTTALFTVFTIYYFTGQRDLNFRLLQAEKERSEGLLRRLETDLDIAARIQRDFLPRHDPRIEKFEISGSNVSCYEVGGDYYDFVPVDPYRLGIAVGDVSGKGIGAALLMASLRAAFRAEVHPRYHIEDMAARLNDFVYHCSAVSSFITFFYCEVDRNQEEVTYVNAGHNPPLVLRTDGSLEHLEGTGFCLGMFSGAAYEAKSICLKPGDILLLFSDGIPDSRNLEEAEYTMDRLVSLLRRQSKQPAAEIMAAISKDVMDFIGNSPRFDDQTLVVVKRVE